MTTQPHPAPDIHAMGTRLADAPAEHRLSLIVAALVAVFSKYMVFPNRHDALVSSLWVLHTWVLELFYTTPRAIADSAEAGSGKTRLLELFVLLCRASKLTANSSTAAIFRRIGGAEDGSTPTPTLLLDEVDTIFGPAAKGSAEDLRGLLNAGYKRGSTIDRCEGDASKMVVREWPVFAPVALAGIAGRMPDTITTRAVTFHLRKRKRSEVVSPFRERKAAAEVAPLVAAIEQWAAAVVSEPFDVEPQMPNGVEDRPAEVWEPLLAIADAAGGPWPEAARAACRYHVLERRNEEMPEGVELLRDIRDILHANNADRIASEHLANALRAMPEAPWKEPPAPMDQRRLASILRRYSVTSRQVRIDGTNRRGYVLAGDGGLADAFDRYLPALEEPPQG